MNMNYSYPTTMYESILAQMYVFLVVFKNFANNIFLTEICIFSENTLMHCSKRTVVHVNTFL